MHPDIDIARTQFAEQKMLGWGPLGAWVVATIVGVPIVFLLPQQALALVDGEGWLVLTIWFISGGVFGAIAGTIVGLVQWLTLRRSVRWANKWMSGTVLGWAIGGALLMLLTRVSYSAVTNNLSSDVYIAGTLAWFACGVGIGFGQWLVLRQHIRGAGWWIGVTALGWGLSVVVIVLATQNATQLTQLMEAGGIVGVGVVLLFFGLGLGGIPGVITGLALNIFFSQNKKSTTDFHA